MSKSVLKLTGEIKGQSDIAMSLEGASDLMVKLESFKEETKVHDKTKK